MSAATDLLVVGGGPVGLAVAIGASERGLRVLVLEPRPAPRDKACGEGLMPEALRQLRALGVSPPAGRSFAGIRYLDGPRRAEGRFQRGAGLGVRRTALAAALWARAERAGVRLEPVAATGLEDDGGSFCVLTPHGRRPARCVVGADGLHSRLRAWAGLEAPEAPAQAARRRFGLRQHFALTPGSDLVEVIWGEGCEAYLTPVGEHELGVAILAGAPLLAQRGPALGPRPAPFAGLLPRLPELSERLRGAAATSAPRGCGPLRQRVRAVTRSNLALVGDASGYFDAITGEGLSLGLAQAAALVSALEHNDLRRYARAHRRLGRMPALLTALTLQLSAHPRLRRATIAALAAQPRTFDRLLDAHAPHESAARPLLAARLLPLLGGVLLRLPARRGAAQPITAALAEGRGKSLRPIR